MQVILAESAGFCYGVKRAVELAQKTAEETQGCWMLGDLIHNAHVVEELRSAGIGKTEDPAALRHGDTVIIRSRSSSMLSSTCACISRLVKSPVISIIRSASVDLP